MKYYHNLYLNEELLRKKAEILYKLENDIIQLNKYVIVLSNNKKNHLEFYNSVMLTQKYFQKQDLLVVGIADGFEGALRLVEKIAQEVYQETADANIREYLMRKQQEFEESKV